LTIKLVKHNGQEEASHWVSMTTTIIFAFLFSFKELHRSLNFCFRKFFKTNGHFILFLFPFETYALILLPMPYKKMNAVKEVQ